MSGQEAALTICGWVVALGLLVIFTRAVELVIAWLKSRIAPSPLSGRGLRHPHEGETP